MREERRTQTGWISGHGCKDYFRTGPKLGAHVSAQGGAYQIFARGHQIGAECLQLFTRAPSQWRAAPLTPEAVARFKSERKTHGNPSVIAHDIYLNNLAAVDEEIRRRSIETMVEAVSYTHLTLPTNREV